MEAVFPDGKPLRINREDFRRQFLTFFPKLAGLDNNSSEADNIIDTSIEAVYDIFTGVLPIFSILRAAGRILQMNLPHFPPNLS